MNTRNYGIDLLRIISMFFVVILHIQYHGNILNTISNGSLSIQYVGVWAIESISICAVNCFALISGYVMCTTKITLKKYIALWFQVLFYSVGLTLLINYLYPDTKSFANFINAIFSVINSQYWYVTAYFGMLPLPGF